MTLQLRRSFNLLCYQQCKELSFMAQNCRVVIFHDEVSVVREFKFENSVFNFCFRAAFFSRKVLGTRYGPVSCRDPIVYDRDPMIIFSDSRDPIFNSRDPNRVPEIPLKKLIFV